LIGISRQHHLKCLRVQLRKIHNVLHGAFRQAVREGLLQRNVIDATEPPKQVKQEVKPLTREKVDGFLAASREDRLHALFVTAVGTAMRRGELLALQWNCVDLVNRQANPGPRQEPQRRPAQNGTHFQGAEAGQVSDGSPGRLRRGIKGPQSQTERGTAFLRPKLPEQRPGILHGGRQTAGPPEHGEAVQKPAAAGRPG